MSRVVRAAEATASASIAAHLALAALLLSGCGDAARGAASTSADGSGGASSTSSASSGGDAAGGGATGGADAVGAGGAGGAVPTREGLILVQRIGHFADDPTLAFAGTLAWFDAEPPEAGESGVTCETASAGSCTFARCIPLYGGGGGSPTGSGGGAPAPAWVSAGDLTIHGDAEELVGSPREDGTYAFEWAHELGFEEPWPSGGTIVVDASGADVPSFTATLESPARFLLAPDEVPRGSMFISRTEDLALAWTTFAGAGPMLVRIDSPAPAEGIAYELIECEVEVADQGVVIARELLERMTSTDGVVPPTAEIFFVTRTATEVVAGDWRITAQVVDASLPVNVVLQ